MKSVLEGKADFPITRPCLMGGAQVGEFRIAADRVINRSDGPEIQVPVLPKQRTSSDGPGMSQTPNGRSAGIRLPRNGTLITPCSQHWRGKPSIRL